MLAVSNDFRFAPDNGHRRRGRLVGVSGFFGSGKSSFAKNLGYALENRTVLGNRFADFFKQQLGDNRTSDLLDLINAKTPTKVILFEVTKESDTRKVTQRIHVESWRHSRSWSQYAISRCCRLALQRQRDHHDRGEARSRQALILC
jgi:hypothetical protein